MTEGGGQGIRIAVEGCCHGELDKIYETLQYMEQQTGRKIDLLICCGDFQAIRNPDDLECMACPVKYRQLGTFWQYYTGARVAPYPTIFVGGNHEAANYLWELYYGGWSAPNIYFLGYAGVVDFAGIRIAGLSGIYKDGHYQMGHHERPPYNDGSVRSAYHVRALEVHRLLQLQRPVDVFVSHDWPLGIAHHGNTRALLQKKAFLRQEVESNTLGSAPNAQLLAELRPRYWFSAHLHTKFAALVSHPDGRETRFLALDKCLPKRQFLQVVDFPEATGPRELCYDPEWLAVLRGTHGMLSLQRHPRFSQPDMQRRGAAAEDLAYVEAALERVGGARVPLNFQMTAPAAGPDTPQRQRGSMPQAALRNPQTEALMQLLGVAYNLDHDAPLACTGAAGGGGWGGGGGGWGGGVGAASGAAVASVANPEELALSDDDVGEEDEGAPSGSEANGSGGDGALPALAAAFAMVPPQVAARMVAQANPEELTLDDEDHEAG